LRDGEPALRLAGVALRGGRRLILEGINLDIPAGALFAVLGEAGSGKSALMSLLTGLGRPTAGQITELGASLERTPAHRRGFGVVTQHDSLFANRSLAENIAYPLRLRGVTARDRAALVETAAESVLLTATERLPHKATAVPRCSAPAFCCWMSR
jgi:putative spermidine/putrescine transport system ATP-binding protein